MYLEKCNESQLKEIYQEFNITEETLKRDVNYLMEWMEKQPHLPNVKDEILLSHLLIQFKNSIERTKAYLDSYYCFKASTPLLYTNRDPTDEGFRNVFDIGVAVPLPKLTPEGYRVIIFRIFDTDCNNLFSIDDYMKVHLMTLESLLKYDIYKKRIYIYDLENINMNLATVMFNSSRKYSDIVQKLSSFRIHKVHVIVNLNPILTTFLNMTKTFMKKKIIDRIVIWNNERPDFTNIIPAEILPEEYGGKEKSIKQLHKMYYEYICGLQEWFKSEENIKADLSKRSDDLYKVSLTDELLDGSFRQLTVD